MRMLFINGGHAKFGNDFRAACAARGVECASLRTVHTAFRLHGQGVEVFEENEPRDLTQFDYAFLRVRGDAEHTASMLMKLLTLLGVASNDPVLREHTKSTEKVTQMLLLAYAGIPIPPTWVCSVRSFKANKKTIIKDIQFPCVLKTNGSKGNAVWKIGSADELIAKMKEVRYELMIIQEYVENTFDIRALYMFGDCLGAIERSATDGFYNNISHGGNATVAVLTPEELALGKRACEVTGIDFGGVDIVRTTTGPKIFEVNCGPQVYGFESATGLTVADELLQKMIARKK